MLFVHADHQGFGAGRLLTEFAIKVLRADSVDVSEHNESAVGFYRYLGFHRIGRSLHDSRGNPFPVLHMALPASYPAQVASLAPQVARARSVAGREGSSVLRTQDGSSKIPLPPP
ncbi:MAG: GNAT family N-acetyltransferase [Steroidobacteraceae bacterium]